jgi:hypothetical protein
MDVIQVNESEKKSTKEIKFCNVKKVVVCTLCKLWKWMVKSQLYVPDDVLEEENVARYQMLSKKSKLRYQKELEKITSE